MFQTKSATESERQLVTAAGRRSIAGGYKLQSGMRARVFDAIPRFIREFAKIHFPRVRGQPEHINVGPRTKNAVLRASDDDRTNLRMFKSNALKRIMQLDIHAEIVGIQFQFVSRADSTVFGDIHRQRGYSSVKRETPMIVSRRIVLKVNRLLLRV